MTGSNSSSTSNNMEGNSCSDNSEEENLTSESEDRSDEESEEGSEDSSDEESEEGSEDRSDEESEGESEEGHKEDNEEECKEDSEGESEEDDLAFASVGMLDGESQRESEEESSEDDDHAIMNMLYDYRNWDVGFEIVTAQQARDLQDVQGIMWAAEGETRKKFRTARLQKRGAKHIKYRSTDDTLYYDFWQYTKFNCFQYQTLTTLVGSTSKHDVYMAGNFNIIHWSGLSSKMTNVLDTIEHVTSSEDYPGNYQIGFNQTRINTMSIRFNLLIVGGDFGQLICKRIEQPGVSFCYKMSAEGDLDSGICAIEIFKNSSGSIHFMVSSEGHYINHFNAETFDLLHTLQFDWPVFHSSLNPRDQQTLLVVGDNVEGRLVNHFDGEAIATLSGHSDKLFASAWHPDGYKFATGSADKTCRIWDIRNTSASMDILKGNTDTIRSLCFTSDGQYMAMGESVDFVHIYDASRFEKEQEVDFFGDVSGVSFSPDTESLFIGVTPHENPNNTHLLWYNRCRNFGSYEYYY